MVSTLANNRKMITEEKRDLKDVTPKTQSGSDSDEDNDDSDGDADEREALDLLDQDITSKDYSVKNANIGWDNIKRVWKITLTE